MYIGFVTLHPVTIPFGNEMMYSITSLCNHMSLLYTGVIKPELNELIEVINII